MPLNRSPKKNLQLPPSPRGRDPFSTLIKIGNGAIFSLLVLMGILIAVDNWRLRVFGGLIAWYVYLPVLAVLFIENAVKIWALKRFTQKIACYVLDTLCLVALTIFTDGQLISTLYIVILSEFYLGQADMVGSVAMFGASLAIFLIARAVTGVLNGEGLHITGLIAEAFNDLLLMAMHFLIFNFAVQLYRRNKALGSALKELEESNKKLQAAYSELGESNEKLRVAYGHLQEVTLLEERQRIAKDIHDTAGHSITTIVMQTEAARLAVDKDPEDAKRRIAAANLQAKNALEELRESVHLLSGEKENLTLKQSLLAIVHESTDGTGIVFRADIEDIELCDAKRRFLRNTLKEGISNGLRHGNATAFYVELKREGDKIYFLLSDNGAGMALTSLKEGFGLRGMSARAEALGGSVRFETEEGEGFEIHITLPADGVRAERAK